MSAPAQAPTATMPLRRVIAMGNQDTPWVFVPIAKQAIAQSGYDPELWFLLASNLCDLGLVTLALEELDALIARRPGVADTPMVLRLRERLDSLRSDRIDPAQLITNARRAVDALRNRGVDLGDAFDTWRESLDGVEWFRTQDANIVRRSSGRLDHLGDQIGAAREIGQTHIEQAASSPAPLTIEGLDPPWLFMELCTRTPQLNSGYQPGIRLIQADTHEFLDGCAMVDLSGLLSSERVSLYIGPEAGQRLREDLANEAGTPIAGAYMPLRSLRTPLSPSTPDLFREAITEQDAQHREHLNAIHARDAQRDRACWRQRLTSAIEGKGEPLRVMITTSRFTTVLHSMCEDLAESLQSQGCQVELLTEPGPNRKLSPLAYSRLLDTFDPDVILAPNHTRRDLERIITGSPTPTSEQRVLPTGVPFVLWFQDAMPHLLTLEAGAAIDELDVVLGFASGAMINELGYPREAIEPAPLVASERRFSIRSVDRDLSERFACEAAMMTHHSETPEAMRERLLGEIGTSPGARRAAESMLPGIEEIIANINDKPGAYHRARNLVNTLDEFDFQTKELLLQNFVLRLVDRALRHQSATWAAEICETRGWRFRIFGKGWESHPTLARFAGGTLPHNSALASAYASAGVMIHVSAFNPLHQRIFECALSGGCPIIRYTQTTFGAARRAAERRVLRDLKPDDVREDPKRGRLLRFDPMRSLDTARLVRFIQQRRGTIGDMLELPDPTCQTHQPAEPPQQLEADAEWVLGDLREMSFDSKASLERLIETARTHPNWRASASEGIAQRTRLHFTHDALARRLVEKLHQRAGQVV